MGDATNRLGILGGQPTFLDGPPTWPIEDEQVRDALLRAFQDGSWGQYFGRHREALIEALCRLHQTDYAWTCASGTVGVELALRGLQVGPGDEVILAAYDFSGNFRAIEATGALPVLVDIDPATWSIDPDAVTHALSNNTRAIIASHLHGGRVDMGRLRQVADAAGLSIVEDACQAPGATIGPRRAGAWGDVGVLSFGGSKLLTAGRGGALVTNRPDVHQRIKIQAERGNDAYPLSELQCAVLLPQLAKLDARNRKRLDAVRQLLSALPETDRFVAISLQMEGAPAFFKLAWRFVPEGDPDDETNQWNRSDFLQVIQAEGVAMYEGFRGFVRRSSQRCRSVGSLENAQRAVDQTVLLHHPILLSGRPVVSQLAHAIGRVLDYVETTQR